MVSSLGRYRHVHAKNINFINYRRPRNSSFIAKRSVQFRTVAVAKNRSQCNRSVTARKSAHVNASLTNQLRI